MKHLVRATLGLAVIASLLFFQNCNKGLELSELTESSSTRLLSDLQAVPVNLGTLPQFYTPNVIYADGIYRMWPTSGDRIRYFTSTDGETWTGGTTVFSAQAGTWEDDGNNFEGYQGGISDARVAMNVTPNYKFTMYYTAGPAPNTATRGGIGVAFSNDGVNWTRFGSNPIRRSPGGNSFAVQAMQVGAKRYFYYLAGGNHAASIAPDLNVVEDLGDGVSFGPVRVLTLRESYPLAYDTQTGKCLWAANVWGTGVTSGPIATDIYSGSDCFTSMGTLQGRLDRSLTGKTSQFAVALVGRDGRGQWSGGNLLKLIFPTGDVWGSWQPFQAGLLMKNATTTTPTTPAPAPVASTPTPTPPVVVVNPTYMGYTMTNAATNSELWSVNQVLDRNPFTVYSSQNLPNASFGAFVASYMNGPKPVNRIRIVARMSGGRALAFPVRYELHVTDSTNARWELLGTYSNQPDANGNVEISLGTRTTHGVMLKAVQLGTDDNGGYYLQLADLNLGLYQ